MKKHCTTLAASLATSFIAFAAVPLEWKTTPRNPAPAAFDRHHGETLDFRCTFLGFGELPFSQGADVRLWYQTNGMGAAWWSVPATVSSNVLAATFPPQADPGADRLALFFGAPSNAYASAVLRLRPSPGFTPNVLPPPDTASFEESDPVFSAWLADGYAIRHPSVEWLDIYGSETPGDGVITPGRPWHRDSWRWYKDYLKITRTFYHGVTELSNDTRTVSLPDWPDGYDTFALASQTSNSVFAIVTGEVAGCAFTMHGHELRIWDVTPVPNDNTSIRLRYGEGSDVRHETVVVAYTSYDRSGYTWVFRPNLDVPIENWEVFMIIDGDVDYGPPVKTPFSYNALGLARLSDLPPLTNGIPDIAARAVYDVHDLMWDATESILYWHKIRQGHDEYIAVTNIDLTNPANAAALKAWRESNR